MDNHQTFGGGGEGVSPGSGTVSSVTAADASIVIGGTGSNPTVRANMAAAAPPVIGPNVGVVGTSVREMRADARPGQNLIAQWTLGAANRRVYLVDGVNGNDANPGFLDGGSALFPISGATVAANAKKTLGALDTIFPRFGNGRNVEIIIANGGLNTVGTYADDLSFLNGYSGYAGNSPLVRCTGTQPTAGATAFAGDAADNTYLGAITVTGLNAPGYNPVAALSNQVVKCLKVGGAAPAFPAEPAAPLGWRIRFDSATTTVALRNVCRAIQVVTTDTLTLQTTLPAVPALTDTFYVEQSGATYAATTLVGAGSFSGGNGGGRGAQIIGLRSVGAVTLNGCAINFAFSGGGTLGPSGGFVNISQTFQSATLGSVTCGGGYHGTGNFSSVLGGCYSLLGAVFEGLGQVLEAVEFNWKQGAVFGTGLQVKGGVPNDLTGVNSIGSENGQLVSRILGASATTLAGLHLASGGYATGAIAITGCGARAGVLFTAGARVTQLLTTILSGSTGNTGAGLSFAAPNMGGCQYNANGNVNTVTGTAGNVQKSDGSILTWANALAGFVDLAGNILFASPNFPLSLIAIANGAIALALGATGPAGLPANPVRYVKVPDGAGGFFTWPSWT